jgi:hypothetical protein
VNEIIAVIAALAGTSGVASILAGGTQFRRTHRLQAQLKELDAVKQLVVPESQECRALEASVAALALELSAYVLIKHDARRIVLLGIVLIAFVGTYLVFAGYLGPGSMGDLLMYPFGQPEDPAITIAGLVIFMTGYIAIFIYVYLAFTAKRRRHFTARISKPGTKIDSDTILRLSQHLNYHRPKPAKRVQGVDKEAAGNGAA